MGDLDLGLLLSEKAPENMADIKTWSEQVVGFIQTEICDEISAMQFCFDHLLASNFCAEHSRLRYYPGQEFSFLVLLRPDEEKAENDPSTGVLARISIGEDGMPESSDDLLAYLKHRDQIRTEFVQIISALAVFLSECFAE